MSVQRWSRFGSMIILLGCLLGAAWPLQAAHPVPATAQHRAAQAPNNPSINFVRKTVFSSTMAGGSQFMLPTVLTFGPDGRLYVGQLNGYIFALTLDASWNVTASQLITRIHDLPTQNDDGSPAPAGIGRQLIGLAFDPTAPVTAPVLYATHSDPRFGFNNDEAAQLIDTHSGTLTRISGPNWDTGALETLISGLPRSRENHSTNSIVWGPDGWLYIAQAGNTNNGAPSVTFSNLPEYFLASSMLRANVHDPAFPAGLDVSTFDDPGDMTPLVGKFEFYATGYRNIYDMLWHSNGTLYANNNGANPGFGDTPGPAICPGGVAINPGYLDDKLVALTQGAYGGHPNPARGECVLDDGSAYSPPLTPLPNYTPPLTYYYGGASTNGIAEYTAPTFGGAMVGDLIAATYSSDQNLRRVQLKPDGTVRAVSTLGAFSQPLDVLTTPDGVILVAEFGGSAITALLPNPPLTGVWAAMTAMPSSRAEVGVAEYDNQVYVFGGVRTIGSTDQRVNTVEVYNPFNKTWSSRSAIPGTALDHIAVATLDNTIYLAGGLTSWPGGAVTTARAYDPVNDSWSLLPPLPAARGAASAVALDGRLYVLGGLDASGNAVNSVFIFDPQTNQWTSGVPMPTARDHLTAQVVAGKIYAIGGRDQAINAVTAAVEIFNPQTGQWTAGADLPLPRGGLGSGVIDGKIIVFGGEGATNQPNGVFKETQEYDPATDTWRTLAPMITPRHGTGGASIGGAVFVPGGAPSQGLSDTNINEAFTLTDFSLGGACPIPASDPLTTDSDGDGYTDQDEFDNGTDRCNQSSVPADFDHDNISDLNDPDDDNDGILDISDQLYLDATNGLGTVLPIRFDWNPGDRPLGYVANTGFTGTQINSGPLRTTPQNLSVGGAGGYLAIIGTSGTSAGTLNNQENMLQLGFDATRPFRVETRIAEPFLGKQPDGDQAGGLFLGLDQDNYVKFNISASTQTSSGSGTGLELVVENASQLERNPTGANTALNLAGINTLDLRLEGDPNTLVLTASYRLNSTSGSFTVLGALHASDHPVLTRFFRRDLSIGLHATAHAAASSIAFVFDYFALEYVGLTPIIALNAGGPTVTLEGSTWLSDTLYIAGGDPNDTYSDLGQLGNIAGTTLDELYTTERNGGSTTPLHYAIPVPAPGLYIVDLHFAEIYFGVNGQTGRRAFDVRLEDTLVLTNYDVASAAGGPLRAQIERKAVEVNDGVLDIYMDATQASSVDRAKLSAVAIFQPPPRAFVPQPVFLPFVVR